MHHITFTWHQNQLLKTPCTYSSSAPNPSHVAVLLIHQNSHMNNDHTPKVSTFTTTICRLIPWNQNSSHKLSINIHHLHWSRWSPLNPLKRKQASIPTRYPLPAFPAWQEWNLWATLRDCYTAKPVPQRAQPARQYKSTNLLPSWFKQLVNSRLQMSSKGYCLKVQIRYSRLHHSIAASTHRLLS